MKTPKKYLIGKTTDLPPGARTVVDLDGKSVGVFNVAGQYYALLNYCPHAGGALCRGPVTGTALPTEDYNYIYGREGAVLRCAWHGWEFDIPSGALLINPKIKARRYQVEVENEEVVVYV